MKALIGAGILVGLVIVLALGWFFMGMHYRNREVELRNEISSKQKANEASFDTTWKIISQQAQVTENYKESFRQIYVDLMNARHMEAGGTFMKWIKEANPKFDSSMFKKLMSSIEGNRTKFQRDQVELLALSTEHNNILGTEPGRWFVGDRKKIDVVIVTSTKSDEAFKTGKEDDVDLFKKKTEPVSTTPAPVEKK